MPIQTVVSELEEERLYEIEHSQRAKALAHMESGFQGHKAKKHIDATHETPKHWYGLMSNNKSILTEAGICSGVILALGHPSYVVMIHYALAGFMTHKLRIKEGYAIGFCFALEAFVVNAMGIRHA